jgi:hypothetical protein
MRPSASGAETGFTTVQTNPGSITEQFINSPTSPNNTLQRATATIGGIVPPTGNWVMQMAIFRDASWTVSGAWSPVRPGNIRYVDQFPGGDIGEQMKNAYADCSFLPGATTAIPFSGCSLFIPYGTGKYAMKTGFAENVKSKPVDITCAPGTTLTWADTANPMFSFDAGWSLNVNAWPYSHNAEGIHNCILQGPAANGGSSAGSSVAIETSGANGGLGIGGLISGNTITGFALGIDDGHNVACDPSNAGAKESFLWVARDNEILGNTTGISVCGEIERLTFDHNNISSSTNAVVCASSSGGIDLDIRSGSMDTTTGSTILTTGGGCTISIRDVHFETNNPLSPVTIPHFIQAVCSNIEVEGGRMINDSAAATADWFISAGTTSLCANTLSVKDVVVSGFTMTQFALLSQAASSTLYVELDLYPFPGVLSSFYNAGFTGCVNEYGFTGLQRCGPLVLANSTTPTSVVNITTFTAAPSGSCPTTNTIGLNAGGTTNSTVLYVCSSGNMWQAVGVP